MEEPAEYVSGRLRRRLAEDGRLIHDGLAVTEMTDAPGAEDVG